MRKLFGLDVIQCLTILTQSGHFKNDAPFLRCASHILAYWKRAFVFAVLCAGLAAQAATVDNLNFTPGRGWFTSSQSVQIASTTPGVSIYYTTDGTFPTNTQPSTSQLYTGPITISQTTVLRAIGYATGLESTQPETHTYIFLSGPTGVIRQPGMDQPIVDANLNTTPSIIDALQNIPSLSIAISPDDLVAIGTPDVEKLCSIEYMLYPNASQGFHVNCGLKINGSSSFTRPKKNLKASFKEIYGPGKLDHHLYPDSPIKEFDSLIMRAFWNDSFYGGNGVGVYMRDQWCHDTQNEMTGYSGHGVFVHLYINGSYNGLYDLLENCDNSFAAAYTGGDKDHYDIIKNGEAQDGTDDAWLEMLAVAYALRDGQLEGSAVSYLSPYLDMTNFIDYMLLNFYACGYDWPEEKWIAARNNSQSASGVFRFYSWDAEETLVMTTPISEMMGGDGPGLLYTVLSTDPVFIRMFGNRASLHLTGNGALTPARCLSRFENRENQIHDAITAESARWGGPGVTRQHWETAVANIKNNWLSSRTSELLGDISQIYPKIPFAPEFSISGGLVAPGTQITMNNPNPRGTIYFTIDGSDPLTADGQISPTALPAPIPMHVEHYTWLRARVFFQFQPPFPVPPGPLEWSGLKEAIYNVENAGLALNEIMYHPSGNADAEFLEIKNNGSTTIDLSLMYFTAGVQYAFPEGTLLGSGEFLLLAKDADAFAAAHPSMNIPSDRIYQGSLDNGGQAITLRHPWGYDILTATYDDASPWPSAADAGGHSLVRQSYYGDPSSASNWRSSVASGGSPGADDPFALGFGPADGLVQQGTEVSINDPNALGTIYFTLDGSDPSVSPTAQAYTGPIPIYNYTRIRARVLTLTGWTDVTESIFNVEAAGLALNEIMYHPSSGVEFLELKNMGPTDIDLSSMYFSDGISYTYPSSILAPGAFIVISENTSGWSGSLDNGGDTITLRSPSGATLLHVHYDDENGWPSADGNGFSLVRKIYSGDPDDPANWRASFVSGGTQGTDDPPSLSSFTPLFGHIGSQVTISGYGFDMNTAVFFGQTKATVLNCNPAGNSLIVQVPVGATYAPITLCSYGLNAVSRGLFRVTYDSTPGSITQSSLGPAVTWLESSSIIQTDVAAGDLNGDGAPDLVVTHYSSPELYIYLNRKVDAGLSASTFDSPVALSLGDGGSAYAAVVADVNGDNKPDLIVPDCINNVVSVFANLTVSPSQIIFAPRVDFAVGVNPVALTLADFDRDGHLDIAVANYNDQTITILRNHSTPAGINFTPLATVLNVQAAPRGITAGDVNNDVFPDIVVSCQGSPEKVKVFRNSTIYRGNIQFYPYSTIFSGGGETVALGDWNQDGRLDIVTGSYYTREVIFLTNWLSTGPLIRFVQAPHVSVPNSAVHSLAVGDLDGDGKIDLAVSAEQTGSLLLFRNETSGTAFGISSAVPFGTGYQNNVGVKLVDLDLDGKLDVVYANCSYSSHSLTAYRNLGLPYKPQITSITTYGPVGGHITIQGKGFSCLPSENAVYFAGFIRAEVVSATPDQLTVTVPAGAKYGNITVMVRGLQVVSSGYFTVTYPGTPGLGTSSLVLNSTTPSAVGPTCTLMTDFDNDGKLDFALATYSASSISLYRNNTVNTLDLTLTGTIVCPSGSHPQMFGVADMDADGRADIVTANSGNNTVTVYLNTTPPGYENGPTFDYGNSYNVGQGPTPIVLADIDRDGRIDIVTGNYTAKTVSILLNNITQPGGIGLYSFTAQTPITLPNNPRSLAVGDLDGDGDMDLLVGSHIYNQYGTAIIDENVRVFQNGSQPGTVLLTQTLSSPLSMGAETLAMGDWDLDGKPDVASGSYYKQKVYLAQNTASGQSITFATPLERAITSDNFHTVLLGDLDGDGKPDLAAAGDTLNRLSLFWNNSSGNFSLATTPVNFFTGSNPNGLDLGDLNGDGKLDASCGNYNANSFSIWLNATGQ